MENINRYSIYWDTLKLLDACWTDVMHDMEVTKQELIKKGYEILPLIPGQVILNEVDDKFGFLVLIPDPAAEKLKSIAKKLGSYKLDLILGQNQSLLVFLIVLKDESNKVAVICPVYYNLLEKKMIEEKGKDNFHIFFRILSGKIILTLKVDNKIFLVS